jgi:hypothetical protein
VDKVDQYKIIGSKYHVHNHFSIVAMSGMVMFFGADLLMQSC